MLNCQGFHISCLTQNPSHEDVVPVLCEDLVLVRIQAGEADSSLGTVYGFWAWIRTKVLGTAVHGQRDLASGWHVTKTMPATRIRLPTQIGSPGPREKGLTKKIGVLLPQLSLQGGTYE